MQIFSSPPLALLVQHPAMTPLTEPESSACADLHCMHICVTAPINVRLLHT